MAITVDEVTKVISVPQADLTFIGAGIYNLDTNVFRLELRAWEASDAGSWRSITHKHNPDVTVGGVTLADVLEIINGYTITFEDLQYRVILIGTNNNILDVANVNQVSIAPTNSAGLQVVASGSGLDVTQAAQLKDLHQFRGLDVDNPLSITDGVQTVDGKTVNVSDDGTTTTVDRV